MTPPESDQQEQVPDQTPERVADREPERDGGPQPVQLDAELPPELAHESDANDEQPSGLVAPEPVTGTAATPEPNGVIVSEGSAAGPVEGVDGDAAADVPTESDVPAPVASAAEPAVEPPAQTAAEQPAEPESVSVSNAPEEAAPESADAPTPTETGDSTPLPQSPAGSIGSPSSTLPSASADPTPRPTPRAAPRPGPRPGPRPPRKGGQRPAAEPQTAPVTEGAADFGRVGDDGSVYVHTADGERLVGQVPDVSADEALAFFTRKYDELAFEVHLLETRVASGALSPEDAASSVRKVKSSLVDAKAVGDLPSLTARLEALSATIAEQRERKRAERAEKAEATKAQKERIAADAEKLSAGNDWRNGANRMRDLLEEWKVLPRLDKAVDDALWRRFSTARTTYTRRRKSHFAELNEQREGARSIKEKLVKEAESLASSTDWGATSSAYRELMRRWKEAGPAPKAEDDELWKRFRAAQDTFFGARDAQTAAQDAEFAENATKKEALLVEAEALLPVKDLTAAKAAFRGIAERWDAAGKVPRERMKDLEARIRKVEQAIRGVEDDAWRRSNPEARARAADTVAQLESSIADLRDKQAKAAAAGNDKKAAEHAAAIEARESWLTEARKALEEFSG